MSNSPTDQLTRNALLVYVVSLMGDTLQAHAVLGLSIPWMAQSLTIVFVLILALQTRLLQIPGFGALLLLIAWGGVVTLANALSGEFNQLMPYHATTPYPVYIGLRLISLLGFASQIYLTYWLLSRGCLQAVVARTTTVAAIAAAIGIYIYFAQLNGWPIPLRTRLGTSGAEQVTTYTYAFHRAVGTFQEPGDLGSWLVFPLYLSFFGRNRLLSISTVPIATALLLSGSLAAIMGSLAGLAIATVLIWPFRQISPARAAQMALAAGAAFVLFSVMAVANDDGSTNLLGVLGDRLQPILDDGVGASNRDYIYFYVADTPIPLIGAGFGNANLLLTLYQGTTVMVSFLSVYFSVLYSTGYVGIVILAFILLAPLRVVLRCRLSQDISRPAGLLALTAAYASYVVMIGFRSEEMPVILATTYGMLTFVGQHYRDASLAMEA